MKIWPAVGLAVTAVTMAGCATMTRGTKDVWEVTSEPPGARVETTNGMSCAATPAG